MAIFNYKRLAKKYSYKTTKSGNAGEVVKRSKSSIKAIVIHNTGGTKDTAKNECDYFATGNTRAAGAHAFIDRDGNIGRSIPCTYTAWSVGDSSNGHGTCYGKYTNSNTISIELCAIANRTISTKQKKALLKLIRYYKKQCPNIKDIVRHYDITTKRCPIMYCGSVDRDKQWKYLRAELMAELKKV